MDIWLEVGLYFILQCLSWILFVKDLEMNNKLCIYGLHIALRSTGWCYLPFCGHFLKDFCVIPPFKNGISLLSVVSILYTTRRRSISCARRDQNLLLQLTEYWKIPLQRSMPNRVKNSQRHIHMNNLNYHRKIIRWNIINSFI